MVDRRSISGLESEVLGMHVCNSSLVMVVVWMRSALRRSEGERDGVLQGRNMECRGCFSQFKAVLLEIASSGSGNADPVLAICKQFARNGALSNGNSGNPHRRVSWF